MLCWLLLLLIPSWSSSFSGYSVCGLLVTRSSRTLRPCTAPYQLKQSDCSEEGIRNVILLSLLSHHVSSSLVNLAKKPGKGFSPSDKQEVTMENKRQKNISAPTLQDKSSELAPSRPSIYSFRPIPIKELPFTMLSRTKP